MAALPGDDGVRLAELAELAWEEWRATLGLPTRLVSGITVRLTPEDQWGYVEPHWRVAVEPGGVVSVWLRSDGAAGKERDRRWLTGLAEGALRRLAVLTGAELGDPQAPAWLAAAAAESVLVAEQPSMLDAWQSRLMREERRVRLREVLFWKDIQAENGGSVAGDGAYGLWLWLREEGARTPAWSAFVRALLAGEAPGAALMREYGRLAGPPADAREWELSWQTALARLARARTTPLWDARESRWWLERVSRIVVSDTEADGGEIVLEAGGKWAGRRDAWPAAEREARARLLAAELVRMHPFYRNAAGSLGRAWVALAKGDERAWIEAKKDWRADMAAGRSLEEASARALDAAEAKR